MNKTPFKAQTLMKMILIESPNVVHKDVVNTLLEPEIQLNPKMDSFQELVMKHKYSKYFYLERVITIEIENFVCAFFWISKSWLML